MDFSKATDEQLRTIVEHELNVKTSLLKVLMNEYIGRGLFDGLIKSIINQVFQADKRDYNELLPEGYLSIAKSLNTYQPEKSTFGFYVYLNMKNDFIMLQEKTYAEKRKSNLDNASLNEPVSHSNPTEQVEFIRSNNNVEKTVVNKLYWEQEFAKLIPREREALLLFSQGYSMTEIATMFGLKSKTSISRQVKAALNKLNPNRPNVGLKELGLMTRETRGYRENKLHHQQIS